MPSIVPIEQTEIALASVGSERETLIHVPAIVDIL